MKAQTIILPRQDRERPIERLVSFLRAAHPGKRVKIEVREYHPRRSTEQNAALWGLAYPILREATGEDVNDLHEYMLGEWSGWSEHEIFGRKKLKPQRRSSNLNRVEFADFFSFIQQRADEYGIYIPDPDPFWREHAA